jgi:hypothetical protein
VIVRHLYIERRMTPLNIWLTEAEAAGDGAPKAEKLSDGLFERRLMEAREENGEWAAKVAELLEARLKDAEEAAHPRAGGC